MRTILMAFLCLVCAAVMSCKKSDDGNPVDNGNGGTPPSSGVAAHVQFTIDGPDIPNKTFTASFKRNGYIFNYHYNEEDDISGWFLTSPEPNISFVGGFKGKSPGVYPLHPDTEVVVTLTVPIDDITLTGLYSHSGALTVYEIDTQARKIRGEFSGEFRTPDGRVYQVTKGAFSIN